MSDNLTLRCLNTLGAVTPNTRDKAEAIARHLYRVLGREPGVMWGKDSNPDNVEHYSGRAIDVMVTQHGWGNDDEMGDEVVRYVLANGFAWGLGHIIWQQRIYPAWGSYQDNPDGGWRVMEDRGSTTNNHMDHPHVYFRDDNPIDLNNLEEGAELITPNDIEAIAEAVWTHIIDYQGHRAAAWNRLADTESRVIDLYDGRAPRAPRSEEPGAHAAPVGLALGNVESRVVQMFDEQKQMASELSALTHSVSDIQAQLKRNADAGDGNPPSESPARAETERQE